MDSLTRIRGLWLVLLAFLLGMLALLLVMLIMSMWRRFNVRQEPKRSAEPMPDLWKEGGRRLVAKLEKTELRPHDPRSNLDKPRDDRDDFPPTSSGPTDDQPPPKRPDFPGRP